jgi:hypothetical protein
MLECFIRESVAILLAGFQRPRTARWRALVVRAPTLSSETPIFRGFSAAQWLRNDGNPDGIFVS